MTVFNFHPLDYAHLASGVVVVIDVLRAFTTAAHAFDAGVIRILPVAGVEEAIQLRESLPDSLIMGEVEGVKPEGFDFGNSPEQIRQQDLRGITLIQRTSAGTQGIVRAEQADFIFAASFVVAKATAEHIQQLDPLEVSLIITGKSMGRDGDEDRACGEYLQALIMGEKPAPEAFTRRAAHSTAGKGFLSDELQEEFGPDVTLSTQADRFNFSLPVLRQGKLWVMNRHFL
jgi:2-phosphosulfolactate phosphatase